MLNRVAKADDGAQRQAMIVERARAIVPLLDKASPRIEKDREIPAEVLAAMHDARLFRMLLPRSCDGDEVEPTTFFQVVELLAMGDASAAWCVGQGSGCAMAAAYLEPKVAREIFGDKDAVMASGPGGAGAKAIAVDGGYKVSGRWMFASGSRHATWLGGHCTVCEADGTPRLDQNGTPVDRTMLFPKESAIITDVWQVMGLRGTGSDNYAVADLFVPAEHSFTRESAADRREPGPLYRFTMSNIYGVAFAAVALGIARATLDAFIALARSKKPSGSPTVLRDNAVIQSQVGLSQAKLDAARTLMLQSYGELWEAASAEGKFSVDQRARMRMVSTYAIHQARDVVDFAYHAAGATAIFDSNPFERRFRDIHAVSQQGQAHASNFELVGQHLLGLQPSSRRI